MRISNYDSKYALCRRVKTVRWIRKDLLRMHMVSSQDDLYLGFNLLVYVKYNYHGSSNSMLSWLRDGANMHHTQ